MKSFTDLVNEISAGSAGGGHKLERWIGVGLAVRSGGGLWRRNDDRGFDCDAGCGTG